MKSEVILRMQQKTAQMIAETTSEVIGYGVLVTDENGVIIGCNDKSRIGFIHYPSLDVMARRAPMTTYKEDAVKLDGVKPGYTDIITLSNQVVGTISIAGSPHRTERYGLLVKKQAEILLREQAFLEFKLRHQLAVRDLAESILLFRPDEDNASSLLLHGKELGFDLNLCRIAVVLEPQQFNEGKAKKIGKKSSDTLYDTALHRITNFFANPAHLIAPLRSQQIALFLALPCSQICGEMETSALALCTALQENLQEANITFDAGIGIEADGLPALSLSAHWAREALAAGRATGGTIHSAKALSAEILLASVPASRKWRHVTMILNNLRDSDEDLEKTFMAWCENPFAPAEVAEKLSIHRNTLQYRLKKIRDILGLNPWNFRDSFTLWSALTLKKFSNRAARTAGSGGS